MSEFRDRYDATAVSGRISQPSFAALAQRGRRRAHRVRTAGVTGVTAIAALVAAPLLTMTGQTGSGTAATPTPDLEPGIWSFRFLDVNYGVVTNWNQPTCEDALFVTEDGGATWSEPRDLPETPGRASTELDRYCLPPDVIPVAPGTLVIPLDQGIEHEYESMELDPPTTSFISRDAGRTWQEYEPQTRTADAVPDGVIPEMFCETDFQSEEPDSLENDWCVDQPRFSWYDAESGDRLVLANNPPVAVPFPAEIASDGSIWVGGENSEGQPHVSVSRDRGRTWQDVSPPPVEDIGESVSAGVAAVDGQTAYLYLATASGDRLWPPQLHRTVDGGETWQPLPTTQPFDEVAAMWVARDGTLLVDGRDVYTTNTPEMYASRDGGETFEETDMLASPIMQISGGFFGGRFDVNADTWVDSVSEDGLTWLEGERPEFRLPVPPTTP